ncbi:hypothetical protein [Lysobacter enzymogenes]|nr:hypothetical protein [Lysobacter enzymogenes]QQP97194.1 hypothetical protein JHW38_03860 [Lysobacter enzymogenes]
MRNAKLVAELAALEVAIPFLRKTLSPPNFQCEVHACRRDLYELAREDGETMEIDRRVRRALACH